MLKSITATSITAVVAVALMSGLTVVLTAVVVPEAMAGTAMASQPGAKGGRLPVLTQRPACALQGWPYYSQSCQFDLRSPNEARTVRVIALR